MCSTFPFSASFLTPLAFEFEDIISSPPAVVPILRAYVKPILGVLSSVAASQVNSNGISTEPSASSKKTISLMTGADGGAFTVKFCFETYLFAFFPLYSGLLKELLLAKTVAD